MKWSLGLQRIMSSVSNLVTCDPKMGVLTTMPHLLLVFDPIELSAPAQELLWGYTYVLNHEKIYAKSEFKSRGGYIIYKILIKSI